MRYGKYMTSYFNDALSFGNENNYSPYDGHALGLAIMTRNALMGSFFDNKTDINEIEFNKPLIRFQNSSELG